MMYKTQWKAVIDKEWETYKSTWEAENPDDELDKTRFTFMNSFMNSFMKDKYLEEMEEVQNSVSKHQEELKAEIYADGEDKNLAYQR